MTIIINKVFETIRKYGMIKDGDELVAGVSGGADSVLMLHILIKLKTELGVKKITAAHLNHNLRPGESLRDESFVKELCGRLGVDCVTASADVSAVARIKGISLEEAGRAARYEFFEGLACEKDAKIVVAHNLNDSIETVILNLTRGTALRGLCGIPPVRGRIIRPLIACERALVEQYLEENDLAYINDSTNEAADFSRNRIRHFVIPQLLKINPGIYEGMALNLDALRRDADYLDDEALKILSGLRRGTDLFDRGEYLAAPKSLRLRILKSILSEKGANVSGKRLLRLDGLVFSGSGCEQLTKGLYFSSNADCFCFTRDKDSVPYFCIPFDAGGGFGKREIHVFSDKKVTLINADYKNYEENINCDRKLLKNAIDCDKIEGTAVIRQRIAGDSIRLCGRNCTKTLKKLFQEAGIPETGRGAVLIAADSRGPFWVEGFGASQRVCVSKNTSKIIGIIVN